MRVFSGEGDQRLLIEQIRNVAASFGVTEGVDVEVALRGGMPGPSAANVRVLVPQSLFRPLDQRTRSRLEDALGDCPISDHAAIRFTESGGGARIVARNDIRIRIAVVNDEPGRPTEQVADKMFIVSRSHATAPVDAFWGVNTRSNPLDFVRQLDEHVAESVLSSMLRDPIWSRAGRQPDRLPSTFEKRLRYVRHLAGAVHAEDTLRALSWTSAYEFAAIFERYHEAFKARADWARTHGCHYYPEDGTAPSDLPHGGPDHPDQPRRELAAACVGTLTALQDVHDEEALGAWDLPSMNTLKFLKEMAFGLLGGAPMNMIRYQAMAGSVAEHGRRLLDFTSWPL